MDTTFDRIRPLALLATLAIPTVASARPLQLMNFEGMQDAEPVDQYYNGGTGGFGSLGGLNLGVTFGANGLCGVDNDVTGNTTIGGDTANEPSGAGSLYWFGTTPTVTGIMNVLGGFSGSFSTKYSALVPATMTIHPGLNGSGPALATLNLAYTPEINPGDPNGTYNTWALASISFNGVARSVVYHGVPFEVRFDDCIAGVPSPGSGAILGLGALAIARRRR